MNNITSIAGSRILIVDDTPANLGVLQKILEADGYHVMAATSGERALAITAQCAPDLIVLDVMMPGLGGLETCRRLKENPETRRIPVIFITALTDIQDTVNGFQAGAVDYVHKPFQREEVSARVRTHLQMCSYLNAYQLETHRLRAILNNMGEGLLIIRPGGDIVSVNPAAQHMLGLPPEPATGLSLFDLLAPPFDDQYRRFFIANTRPANLQDPLRHGPHEVEWRCTDGRAVHLDLTITHVFSTEPMLVCLLHDISAHKRSHDELLRIASTDPLTGIANRRHFDLVLKREWQRAERSNGAVSLAIFDVDHFKGYNDSMGHHAGDVCLQQVAAAIASVAHRPTDMAARFGGEEFVLVAVDTDADGAQKLANDARCAVEALALPHPVSPAGPHVTISGGVVTLSPAAGGAIGDLLTAADAALYRAKEQGRNRIVRA